MVIPIDGERLARAESMAKMAPNARGINRPGVSAKARTWASTGPSLLREVLERAAEFAKTIAMEERSIDEATRERGEVRRLLSNLTDPDNYPALSHAMIEAAEHPSSVAGAPAVAASLFRARAELRSQTSRLLHRIDGAPSEAKHQQLGVDQAKKVLEAKIANLSENLASTADALLSTSAELEGVEHHHHRATRQLQDLRATGETISAQVEQDHGPVAATRLYHNFRESHHYVEYRREAEEARKAARSLEAERDRCIEDHNQLVDKYNSLLGAISDMQNEIVAKAEELQTCWAQEDHLQGTIAALQESLEELQQEVRALQPVNVTLPASAYNPLIREGLLTYGQVAQKSRQELLAFRGLGEGLVGQIEGALAAVGLALRSEWD